MTSDWHPHRGTNFYIHLATQENTSIHLNETTNRVADIAKKAGVINSLEDIESLHSTATSGGKLGVKLQVLQLLVCEIKSSSYSRYYAKACNEWRDHLRGLASGQHCFKETLATICPISLVRESNPRSPAGKAMCVATGRLLFCKKCSLHFNYASCRKFCCT